MSLILYKQKKLRKPFASLKGVWASKPMCCCLCCFSRHPMLKCIAGLHISMLIRRYTCFHKNMQVCVHPSVLDALTTPQLLPSASFRRHNFSRLIIAVNHCCLPTVFYPAAPLCPCPLPPTLLRARLATARRNELSCIWETEWKEERGFKSCWWAHCLLWRRLSRSSLEHWWYSVDLD